VLTAVENVELPLLVSKEKPHIARTRALEALDMVELKDWAMHRPAELSGGQRQRVTIARALVNNPLIVFGDELTGDLDRKTSDTIMDLIIHLNRDNNQTFVIVTHDQKVAEKAHRVLKMGSGVIEKEYTPTPW
jgi:putative ABC transport system ATP-binding protein